MSSENLNSLLNKTSCYCLNEDPSCDHTNVVGPSETGSPLRSNADEQLLLQLAFNQTVMLHAIDFGVPNDSSCPLTIKLFANKLNMGFDDANGSECVCVCIPFSFLPLLFIFQFLHFFFKNTIL